MNDRLVLASVYTTKTHVDGVCVVGADVDVLVLTARCPRDVHRVFVTFLLFIRLDR